MWSGRALGTAKGRSCLTIPSNAIPGQSSLPGGAELGSKPSMASASKTAQPVVSGGIGGPDYSAPSGKVGLARKLLTLPGQGWSRAGQGGRRPGFRVACLEFLVVPCFGKAAPARFAGCGWTGPTPQKTGCWLSSSLVS